MKRRRGSANDDSLLKMIEKQDSSGRGHIDELLVSDGESDRIGSLFAASGNGEVTAVKRPAKVTIRDGKEGKDDPKGSVVGILAVPLLRQLQHAKVPAEVLRQVHRTVVVAVH